MERFSRALELTLRFEGGYVDHPDDPGGATNKGVTQRSYDRWLESRGLSSRPVKEITDMEVRDVYWTRYWKPSKAPDLPKPADVLHFDCAVNSGVKRATRLLQAAAGAAPDGIFGPRTLAAVERAPRVWLADSMLTTRLSYYRSITDGKLLTFLRGWIWRLEELEHAIKLPRAPNWRVAA